MISLFASFLFLSLSIASTPPSNKQDVNSETPSPQPSGETVDEMEIPKSETFKITNVIDGDTVKIENGQVVRLIGMDAPETSQSGECYSKEATKKLEELVLDKEVRLEKDVSETDKYGRLLRYLWTGDDLINEILVREGFAKVSTYPPDVKYKDRFIEAERLAREKGKGLWGEACKPTQTSTPKPATMSKSVSVSTPTPVPVDIPPAQTGGGGNYVCNCSKTCAQMSSCAEAQYQLNICGCSARDGDDDGIACDSDCQ